MDSELASFGRQNEWSGRGILYLEVLGKWFHVVT